MKSLESIGLLAERPAYLIPGLFLLLLAAAMPPLMSGDMVSMVQPVGGGMSFVLKALIWRETILLSAFVGVMVGWMTSDFRATLTGWSLPALRQQHAKGAAIVGFSLASIVAVLHGSMGGPAIAAFGVCAAAFAGGMLASAGVFPWRLLVAISLAAVIVVPDVVIAAIDRAPAATGVVALLAAAGMLLPLLSLSGHRDGVQRWLELPARLARHARYTGTGVRERTVGYNHRATFKAWFAAERVRYSGPLAWTRARLWESAFIAILSYLLNSPVFLPASILSAVIAPPLLGVSSASALPLSRQRRADIMSLTSFAAIVQFAVFASTLTALLSALDPITQFMASRDSLSPFVYSAVAVVLVWIPILQYALLYPPIIHGARATLFGAESVPRIIACMFAVMALFVVSWHFYAQIGPSMGGLQQVLMFTVAIASTNLISALALRRAYARRDLV